MSTQDQELPPPLHTGEAPRKTQDFVQTARLRLDSSFFPANQALSAASEVEAARAAALDLTDALGAMSPDDQARSHVEAALRATIQVIATHAGAASDWAPSGWWYEAKELTKKAYEELGRPSKWPHQDE